MSVHINGNNKFNFYLVVICSLSRVTEQMVKEFNLCLPLKRQSQLQQTTPFSIVVLLFFMEILLSLGFEKAGTRGTYAASLTTRFLI